MSIYLALFIIIVMALLFTGAYLSFRKEQKSVEESDLMVNNLPKTMDSPDSQLVARLVKGDDFTAVVSDGTITEIKKVEEIKIDENVSAAPAVPGVKATPKVNKNNKSSKPAPKTKQKNKV